VDRSQLFAPGHDARLLGKVFDAGADAVLLDLEDAVPPELKATARALVADALRSGRRAWVRINQAGTDEAAADLDVLAALGPDGPVGIRVPKTESAEDVRWVAQRVPGVPLTPAIETARGVLAAAEIAAAPAVRMLAVGGIDLQRDLGTSDGALGLLYVRSHLVVCSRAAAVDPPIDSVYPYLADLGGLRDAARLARSLGLFGKSTVHPRQLPVIHEAFTPTDDELGWAREVVAVFDAAGGAAARLSGGEFVDRPVADRARRLLELAARIAARG